MKEPVWLLKSAVLAIQNMMIARFGGPAGIRDEGLLDSALARPLNLFHYERCSELPRLAACYAAGIIQDHPFVDGNKRSGFMSAYLFLVRNGCRFSADEVEATAMTLSLASSEVDEAEYSAWLARVTTPSKLESP